MNHRQSGTRSRAAPTLRCHDCVGLDTPLRTQEQKTVLCVHMRRAGARTILELCTFCACCDCRRGLLFLLAFDVLFLCTRNISDQDHPPPCMLHGVYYFKERGSGSHLCLFALLFKLLGLVPLLFARLLLLRRLLNCKDAGQCASVSS